MRMDKVRCTNQIGGYHNDLLVCRTDLLLICMLCSMDDEIGYDYGF